MVNRSAAVNGARIRGCSLFFLHPVGGGKENGWSYRFIVSRAVARMSSVSIWLVSRNSKPHDVP